MSSKTISLSKYIAWVSKKYNELLQETQNKEIYRIVEVKNHTHETCKVRVHIVGTDKTIEWIPQDILADDRLLEGFSKKDIRTLTYYACKEINKPKFKIISHGFSDRLKKVLFLIKNLKTNEEAEATASKISLNKEMINQLNPEDAHRIGYWCGNEEVLKEKEMLEKLKKENPEKNKLNLVQLSEHK